MYIVKCFMVSIFYRSNPPILLDLIKTCSTYFYINRQSFFRWKRDKLFFLEQWANKPWIRNIIPLAITIILLILLTKQRTAKVLALTHYHHHIIMKIIWKLNENGHLINFSDWQFPFSHVSSFFSTMNQRSCKGKSFY